MTADWPGLDEEGKSVIYQRLYLYALVAAYDWPTAIAATNAVGGEAVPLPPGITPIVQGARRSRQHQQPQQQRQQQPARPDVTSAAAETASTGTGQATQELSPFF